MAVDLPSDIKEKMREVQEALRQSHARLAHVDPSIIHITIKFLGEIEETRAGPVSDALKGIRLEPFDLSISGISTNNNKNPRVVWGNVVDGGGCRKLFDEVETALAAVRVPREQRGFTPHATLARVKVFDPTLIQAIRPYISGTLGECRISGFALKKSTLTPAGPVYDNIMEVTW